MPAELSPQLATLVRETPAGDEWLHELKYDGFRVLSRLERGRVAMMTRGGLDWSERFEPVARALQQLPVTDAVLDGEVAVVLPDGPTSFQALQNQLKGDSSDLVYFVFDLLHLDGVDLTGVPLERRKALLEPLLRGPGVSSRLRFSDHVIGDGPRFHAEVCKRGLEGIVSKRRDSKSVGARTASWVKVKCSARQELVIGGYTDPGGSRSAFGALLLGVNEGGTGLRYCGKVGTGFSEETLGALLSKLKALETERSPFTERPPDARHAHWVEPTLVAEVAFQAWTGDGRLRHPSFLGLREDKPAEQVVREQQRPPPMPAPEPARVTQATFGDLTLTHPDKVLFPESGLTKLTVARYLELVGPCFLEHARGRPIVLVRCPETREQCFYQKHPGTYVPRTLGSVRIRERHSDERYLVLGDERGLLELAQLGVLEVHLWGALARDVERPDRVVFDFDPDPKTPWKDVADGAVRMRQLLERVDLVSFVKTTGGKGLHVVVPIKPGPSWEDVKVFSAALASQLIHEAPERYTANLVKAKRGGRLFLDTLRNRRGSTWVAPFSPRARAGAPVSMPVEWSVVETGERPAFDVQGVLDGGARPRDAWAGMNDVRQSLTRSMLHDLRRESQP
jgi:bifunctional non-homologous end joining protein LigD